MNRGWMFLLRRYLAVTILCCYLTVLFPQDAVHSFNGGSATVKEVDIIEKTINWDSKKRIGKIIFDSIKEDRAQNRPIDFKKMQKKILNKPLITHFAIQHATGLTSPILQYCLMGLAPPWGTAIATLAGGMIGGLGSAVGYEYSVNMENGEGESTARILNRAVKSISAPYFLGSAMGGIAGAVLGQVLCPIPFLGILVGNTVGSLLGGYLSNLFVKTPFGKKFGGKIQQIWNNSADSLYKTFHHGRGPDDDPGKEKGEGVKPDHAPSW